LTVDSPEFEPEFYEKQVLQMKERYATHFKKWRYSWPKYIQEVENSLRNKTYWIWCYLVGFEKFLQMCGDKKPLYPHLEKDRTERIYRIVGDFYKNEAYVRDL